MAKKAEAKAPVTAKAEKQKAEEKTYTAEELNKIVAEAVSKALSSVKTEDKKDKDAGNEKVKLVFLGQIAEGTCCDMGAIGKAFRCGQTISVRKETFLQNLTPFIDALIRKREIVILDGFDEEERERFGVEYKEGENITVAALQHLLDIGADELVELYAGLCEQHRAIVVKSIYTAYADGDKRVTPSKIKKLSKIDGDSFATMLKDIGANFGKID